MLFLNTFERSLARLYLACGYGAAACLVVLAALVIASIVSRLLSVYVPGLVEYSGYAMAASSFLALAYTFGEKGHIRVALLLNRLPPAPHRLVELWCLLVASICTGYLAFYAVKLTWLSWRFEERSEGADAILIWIPQSIMAFGATVFFICVLHALIGHLFHSAAGVHGDGGSRGDTKGTPA
jgi:TRAP-type C4-dicarboxylate transport system permease small subunit